MSVEFSDELKIVVAGVVAEVAALKQQADIGSPAGDVTLLVKLTDHLQLLVPPPG